MSEPLDQIEDAKGQHDLGVLSARVYRGAQEEADAWSDGFWATVALLVAMLNGPPREGE